MPDNKDYTKSSFRITFLVIAIMLAISFIPPFSIGNVHFRRANILADVITFNDDVRSRAGELTELDRQFLEEAEQRGYLEPEKTQADDTNDEPLLEHDWEISSADGGVHSEGNLISGTEAMPANGGRIFKFDDYTADGRPSVGDFARMMGEASKTRVVRIAFFGDSYIEGDIITADVREQLQNLYGGQGVGFVPLGNPLAISRPTVTHTFEGWENHNLLYKKNATEELQNKFFVSGIISLAGENGASSQYKGTKFRKHINSWSRARLIFINDGGTVIDMAVNDSIRKQFKPDRSGLVQQINLTGNGMRSLDVRVAQPEGFIGYGVVLDGMRGVAVDNFAIRSNSGIAFFGTDRQINTQIGRMLGYDLIVLQWGLNAMSPDVTDYSAYGTSLKRVVNYVKACFPQSAIVIMGVGDRATQRDGDFVTMEAVAAMRAVQKSVAKESGVAYWDTFEAMGGDGSIKEFVEKQWAAKDYMHLSYGGGRYIATRFVQALLDAKSATGEGGGNFAGEDTVSAQDVRLDLSTATEEATKDTTGVTVERAGEVRSEIARDSTGTEEIKKDSNAVGDPAVAKDPYRAGEMTGGKDSIAVGETALSKDPAEAGANWEILYCN